MTELGPEARRLLELTRAARTPSARDRARVERLVSAAIPAAAAVSAPARAAFAAVKAKALAAPLAVKVAVASVAVAAIVAVGLARRAAPRAVPASDVAAPVVSAVIPAVESPPNETAPAAVPAELPRAMSSSAERKIGRPRAAASDTLAQELDLLHEAQAKWRSGDADGALSLLALHRERYPRSEVAPERDALRVLSLCATGRAGEARKVAQHFAQRYPRSPLRASVEESCALR